MYELWQSQCVSKTGLLDLDTLSRQPFAGNGEQRTQYQMLGEIAFVEEKKTQVLQEIVDRPSSFLIRVARRAVAATSVYFPFEEPNESMELVVFANRFIFPIPFISLICVLIFKSSCHSPRFSVAATILISGLIPYIVVSYYERYASPFIGMKMLVVLAALRNITECAQSLRSKRQLQAEVRC